MDLYICSVASKYTLQLDFTISLLQQELRDHVTIHPTIILGKRFTNGSKDDPYKFDVEQTEARNLYLEKVPEGSFMLILDDDETIGGAINTIPLVLQRMRDYNINTCYIRELLPDGTFKRRPRILKKTRGMTYYWKHDIIVDLEQTPSDILTAPHRLIQENTIGEIYNYIHPSAVNSMTNNYLILVHFKDLKNIQFVKPTGIK